MSDLDDLIRARALDIVEEAARVMVDDTAAAAPVAEENGGTLRDSHRHETPIELGTTVTVELVADTDYAGFVAGGTIPHPIRPVRARVLRFKVGGDVVFAAHVNHPGTQPNTDWWSEQSLTERWRAALEQVAS